MNVFFIRLNVCAHAYMYDCGIGIDQKCDSNKF
jgi:hypothetical protein